MAYTLPDLPYPYDHLEPHIDAQTMQIHHDKHHAAYVTNLNKALETAPKELQDLPIEKLITQLDKVPEAIRPAVRNNGGGHYNHSLFWRIMNKGKGGQPTGKLADAIKADLGGFDKFKTDFTQAGMTQFGSGWAWLIVGKDGKLAVVKTPNQDNPLMTDGGTPILGCDVWEHAYYLKYKNVRPEYIAAWWNVVDWDAVAERYAAAKK